MSRDTAQPSAPTATGTDYKKQEELTTPEPCPDPHPCPPSKPCPPQITCPKLEYPKPKPCPTCPTLTTSSCPLPDPCPTHQPCPEMDYSKPEPCPTCPTCTTPSCPLPLPCPKIKCKIPDPVTWPTTVLLKYPITEPCPVVQCPSPDISATAITEDYHCPDAPADCPPVPEHTCPDAPVDCPPVPEHTCPDAPVNWSSFAEIPTTIIPEASLEACTCPDKTCIPRIEEQTEKEDPAPTTSVPPEKTHAEYGIMILSICLGISLTCLVLSVVYLFTLKRKMKRLQQEESVYYDRSSQSINTYL